MIKIGIFIGRFAPVHYGHLSIIQKAVLEVDKLILVLGSSNKPRSIRNIFSDSERKELIVESLKYFLSSDDFKKIRITFINDFTYNNKKWCAAVESSVFSAMYDNDWYPDGSEFYLVGHSKDASSYYLKMFPRYKSINYTNFEGLNSTEIREHILENRNLSHEFLRKYMPAQTAVKLIEISDNIRKNHSVVFDDYEMVKKYRKSWENSPYPPVFKTVDALVTCGDSVLLVQRGASPGKGQLALPGGFVNQYETCREAALRELIEETRIDIPQKTLSNLIKSQKEYDDPWRSTRGRTFTTCFWIDLVHDIKLPKVKGSDDAQKALWVPISQLKTQEMYEDHYDIISDMLGV
jgi:bifunctional NMN adenylyltransferase/nudix hydrolase